jgi:hypothetical protein
MSISALKIIINQKNKNTKTYSRQFFDTDIKNASLRPVSKHTKIQIQF